MNNKLKTRHLVAETDLVDLHTHSVANDGRWRADRLARAAATAGIRVLALTDHDTTMGVGSFADAARFAGVLAIPGVEVSCWWRGSIYHVLLYGVDTRNAELVALLRDLWVEIRAVASRARDQLRERGYVLAELEAARGGEFLPVDVIVAAMRAGVASSFPEVVEALVDQMGLSFLAGADMQAAVSAGHAAGGVAVLAHPGRAEFGFTVVGGEVIAEMVAATGLDGLEVYHWSHGPAEVATYSGIAADLGLLVSCGSDSHGPNPPRGLRGHEARLCRDLLARLGVDVAPVVGEGRLPQ
ncbi:MAG: PHP domain-containing protein [Chloroflexota bacterium]